MTKVQPVGNFELAMVYASLGENDQAIYYLEQAFKKHEGMMTYLKPYSRLIPGFKFDPRLINLINRVGIGAVKNSN